MQYQSGGGWNGRNRIDIKHERRPKASLERLCMLLAEMK